MKSTTNFRVRYQETDKMGVVHHSVYLVWFEVGRTEWLRQQGLSYRECEEKGWLLPVVESGIRHLSPARYDDLIEIETNYIPEPGATFRFDYVAHCPDNGRVLATGFTKHVCIDKTNRVNKEATKDLKKMLN
jgi:acyl-CoA thioester hydrolase, YbgC/YbaW family